LDWALRWTLLIGVPASVALIILAGSLLSTLFQYGQFKAYDVQMASRSLMAYSLGLLAFMLIKVLAPGFYARQDTRTPVRIGITAMVVNMILNIILIVPLAHVGLALATSLSSYLNAVLLYRHLRRHNVYRPAPGWPRFFVQLGMANLCMGLVLWFSMGELSAWLEADAGTRLWHLTWLVVGGLCTYILSALLVGIRPRHLKM
jgi:putative peptidoglycan lipid II flippase